MSKMKKWQHNKEFDTKTLLTDIDIDKNSSPDNTDPDTAEQSAVTETKNAAELKDLSEISSTSESGKKTQVYEPRPLTPDDDIYEDILEQFASAPTKPKYWFEEFGDYWSCSCGHINKGDRCKNCGIERELLRSLFILHKPAGEPGKLSKKLKKTKELVDKETALQYEKDRRLKESSNNDINNIRPIEDSDPKDDVPAAIENDTEHSSPSLNDTVEQDKIEDGNSDTSCMPEADKKTETKDTGINTAIVPADTDTTTDIQTAKNCSKKKMSTKKLVLLISAVVFVIAVLSVGGYFTYKYLAAPAMAYDEAKELQAAGKYEDAIKKFEELGDYKDSKDLIWECYCGIGDDYFDKGKYNNAIKTYRFAIEMKDSNTLHDKIWQCYCKIGDRYLKNKKYTKAIKTYNKALELKDSDEVRSKINKAKFGYISANSSSGGSKFETYLNDLMKIKYSGTQEIYDAYYAWHVSIIANNSEDDFENDMDNISRHETAYFHTHLSGGEPNETITLYYEVTWPNGTTQTFDMDNSWKAGAKITARFQYPIPLFGKEGTLTFKLYDKSTQELLGTDKVTFTK